MASYKIGDRVRIHCPGAMPFHGRQATVVGVGVLSTLGDFTGTWLDVDGLGSHFGPHNIIALDHEIIPALPDYGITQILALKNLPDFDCPRPVAA